MSCSVCLQFAAKGIQNVDNIDPALEDIPADIEQLL